MALAGRLGVGLAWLWLAGAVAQAAPSAVAGGNRFGDIVVLSRPLADGSTHRGYCEHRFEVQNLSESRARQVTLVLPNAIYRFGGNTLGRISRTVTVGPESSASVSLWQPPLPVSGDHAAKVRVDGRERGVVSLASGIRHMASGMYGSGDPSRRAFLVSRSLNRDEIEQRLERVAKGDYSPDMATGPPDTSPSGGPAPTAWAPASPGAPVEWLELDYTPPLRATEVRIHKAAGPRAVTEIVLFNTAETELARVPAPSGAGALRGGTLVLYPETQDPVARVRLILDAQHRGWCSIDAVELVGPDGRAWAAGARASSTYSGPSARRTGSRSGAADPGFDLARAEIEAAGWSEQWLAYSGYDGILLSAADYAAMPPAVRSALWRYAECGGNLVVFGRIDVPELWRASRVELHRAAERYHVGFGQCLMFAGAPAAGDGGGEFEPLRELARESRTRWFDPKDEQQANTAFPIVENLGVPVRGLVTIMLGFVLLIGPGNLFVLAKLKRRIWLLWTVPAISLVTCLAVFAYSLLSEGVTPHVRTESFTVLDQAGHRATTLGVTAFYCPLTPGGGLRFGFDTEVTPLVTTHGHQGGTTRELDCSQAQHLASGWVLARVPAHFQLRKSETRRERLQVERAPEGGLTVLNGLGADIESLWIADADGRILVAGKLRAGQTATLTPAPQAARAAGSARSLTELFEYAVWAVPGALVTREPAKYLRPGTYIAALAEAPFAETALAGRTKARQRGVVYGFWQPEGKAL